MSKLEELLNKECPDGVEYVELSSVINYEQPSKYIVENTKYNDDYDTPVLTAGQTFILGYTNEKDGIYKASKKEPVIIFDDFTTSFHWVDFNFKVKSSAMKMLKVIDENKSNFRYLYFCMKNIKYIPTEHARQWIEKYSKFMIPLPPIEVQKEIVRILDTFTKYQDLLNRELELRKKQYEYYRDKLLTFGDDVELKKLGEIANISRGGKLQKKDFVNNGFPCIHYGQIHTKYSLFPTKTFSFIPYEIADKEKKASKNDIIMAVTSENVDDVCKCIAWLGNTDVAVGGHTAIISHNQNPKYLAYYFNTSMFFYQKIKIIQGTKVMEVSPNKLKNILIPVPPLDEQERIVNILDKFDALCNDITRGLPAEIEMRKKQYEYYRDKLLTFKEKNK